MKLIEDIKNAKHIVIEVEIDFLASGSALYTYILQQHKKVSFVCFEKNLPFKLTFLPWFDKIRWTKIDSADLKIELKLSCIELYKIFKESEIKVNPKMATSLYAGLLQETDGFLNTQVDGTIFAMAKELVEAKAQYKSCNKFIRQTTSLASFRLKAIMFKNMLLQENASKALFYIDDVSLKEAGATLSDCFEIILEGLNIVHVEQVMLIKSDEKNKILKLINKEK